MSAATSRAALVITLWRILIICCAGLALSWVPHIYRTRIQSDDPISGGDLAIGLGFILAAIIVGNGQSAAQHLHYTLGLPLTTIGLLFLVRARIRAFKKEHDQ